MAGRDVFKEVIMQMQNLKLSSPLRTDQGKDDNKENILEVQDLRKARADGNNLDPPVLTQGVKTTENQISDIDVNCQLEGFKPGPLQSSVLNLIKSEETSNSVNSECLADDSKTAIEFRVNSSSLNDSEQLLSNLEQKTSTQSLYDDCIDILEKQTEGQDSPADLVKNDFEELNSTYAIGEEPLETTLIVSNSCETIQESVTTQVIPELNATIVKYEELPVNKTFCEEEFPSNNFNDSDRGETCDKTFIELSQKPDQEAVIGETIRCDTLELPTNPQEAAKETKISESVNPDDTNVLKTIEKNISNSSELDSSLADITKNNRSIEDLEKSTAKLVSDSSDRSLNTSQLSDSITYSSKSCEVREQVPCTDTHVTLNTSEATEKSNICILNSIEQLDEPSENSGIVPGATSNNLSSLEIPEQTSCKKDNNSEEVPSSPVEKKVEEINLIVDSEANQTEVENVQSSLAIERPKEELINQNPEEYISAKKMEEMNTKLQQEFSDIKLELNAVQQAKAILELEVSKKDEIILKTEAESIKKEQQYLQDIKALQEQLKEKEKKENSMNEKDSKDSSREFEEALKDAEANKHDFMKVLEQYEKTIAASFSENKNLQEENAAVNRHLSNLESSFSDLLTKYEKAKIVITGYKRNEDKLKEKLTKNEETFKQQEGRYESLKAHAQSQFDKGNLEFTQFKERAESEITKLKAIVKRLEIKNGALETSLAQKTKECLELAALCDEVTGNKKF